MATHDINWPLIFIKLINCIKVCQFAEVLVWGFLFFFGGGVCFFGFSPFISSVLTKQFIYLFYSTFKMNSDAFGHAVGNLETVTAGIQLLMPSLQWARTYFLSLAHILLMFKLCSVFIFNEEEIQTIYAFPVMLRVDTWLKPYNQEINFSQSESAHPAAQDLFLIKNLSSGTYSNIIMSTVIATKTWETHPQSQ